jgi:F-type H+-transporting ATPase subunit a
MTAGDELGAGSPATNVAGVALNLGTVRSSAIAAAVVIGVGLWARHRVTAGRPGPVQLAWETAVGVIDRRMPSGSSRTNNMVVPLAISLFGFILVANSLRVVPGTSGWLPTATADLNLTVALAIIVMVAVHAASIRSRGLAGYFKHYLQPHWALAPLNVLQELIRPVTLALRLFGTAFAGGLVIALIGELIPPAVAPLPHVIWSLFDLGIGVMQAFIYSLLTVLYYESAIEGAADSPTLPPLYRPLAAQSAGQAKEP